MTLKEYFTGIADAVRTKDGSTGKIQATGIPSKIRSLVLNTDVKSASGNIYCFARDPRTNKVTGNFTADVKSVKSNASLVTITMGSSISISGQDPESGTFDILLRY